MRFVAAFFLVGAVVLAALFAVGFYADAREDQFVARARAETELNKLSTVSSDLVSPEELAKMRAAEAKRAAKRAAAGEGKKAGAAALRHAVMMAAAVVLLLVAAVLALVGRGRLVLVGTSGLALLAVIATLVLEASGAGEGKSSTALLAICAVAALVGCVLGGWALRRPREPATDGG